MKWKRKVNRLRVLKNTRGGHGWHMPRHCCCGCWGLRNWSHCASVAPQDTSLPRLGQHHHGDDSCSSKQALGLWKPLAPTACLREPSQHWRPRTSILNSSQSEKHWPPFMTGACFNTMQYLWAPKKKKTEIKKLCVLSNDLIEWLVSVALVPLFCICLCPSWLFHPDNPGSHYKVSLLLCQPPISSCQKSLFQVPAWNLLRDMLQLSGSYFAFTTQKVIFIENWGNLLFLNQKVYLKFIFVIIMITIIIITIIFNGVGRLMCPDM